MSDELEKLFIFAGEKMKNMCTYNLTLNDTLIEKARPAFTDDSAFQHWLQEQVSAMLEHFVNSQKEKEQAQQAMVRESLATAFKELHSGKAKKDARSLFAQ